MTTILPPRNADDHSVRFIGLDLAKKETQAAVLNSDGKQIASTRFAATAVNYRQLATELGPHDCVAFEVSTNSFNVARILMSSPARVRISDPVKTKAIASAKIKTDKIDARVLAELDRADYLPTVWLPDLDTDRLRHLMSSRQSLVDRRTELKNRVHGIFHREIVDVSGHSDLFSKSGSAHVQSASALLDHWDRAELISATTEIAEKDRRIAQLETAIASFICSKPPMLAMADLLLSIPGVSLVVAAGLVAAIGDISRFTKRKQLPRYFGLIPSTYQSGDSRGYHGRITKQGRAHARWLLIEAAEHVRKSHGPLRGFYLRILKKRNHNVAIVAVARKLAEIVFHMLSNHEDYLYSPPRLTDEKRARLRFFASQAFGPADSPPDAPHQPSAQPHSSPRSPLYGSGLQARKLKTEIVRQASAYAEAAYNSVVNARAAGNHIPPPAGFDPTRPSQIHWHSILEKFASALGSRSKPATPDKPNKRSATSPDSKSAHSAPPPAAPQTSRSKPRRSPDSRRQSPPAGDPGAPDPTRPPA